MLFLPAKTLEPYLNSVASDKFIFISRTNSRSRVQTIVLFVNLQHLVRWPFCQINRSLHCIVFAVFEDVWDNDNKSFLPRFTRKETFEATINGGQLLAKESYSFVKLKNDRFKNIIQLPLASLRKTSKFESTQSHCQVGLLLNSFARPQKGAHYENQEIAHILS